MNLRQVLKNRRSIRKFKSKKVPKKVLKEIIEAARWAPSAHNLQSWHFVVAEKNIKDEIADMLSVRRKSDPLFIKLIYKDAVSIIRNAPLVILVYNKPDFSKRMKRWGRRYYTNAHIWEIQGVACAVQNMLLAVYSCGLGATWLGIPLFRSEKIDKLAGTDDELMAVLAVGYPDEKPAAPKRKPVSGISTFLK